MLGLIRQRLVHRLYDRRLLQNNPRGDWVEEIAALALEPDYEFCSQDWAGVPSPGRYDISPAAWYWIGPSGWRRHQGRLAAVYVVAWHPETGDGADHRDPEQWRFFTVPKHDLPPTQKSIGRAVIERRYPAMAYEALKSATDPGVGAVGTSSRG